MTTRPNRRRLAYVVLWLAALKHSLGALLHGINLFDDWSGPTPDTDAGEDAGKPEKTAARP